MKICKVCLEDTPLGDFFKRASAMDGLTYACKPCTKKQNKKWIDKNPDRVAEAGREWVRNNREKDREKKRRHIVKTGNLYNERRCLRRVFTGYKIGSKPHRLLGAAQPIALAHLLKTWEDRYGHPLLGDEKHIDHIVPIHKGGAHHYRNLQLLTPSDNSKKGVQ